MPVAEDITAYRGSPLSQAGGVCTKAFKQPVVTDDALHYLIYLLLDTRYFLIPNHKLHAEGEKLDELAVHGDVLRPIFCSLPESFAKVLGAMRPKAELVLKSTVWRSGRSTNRSLL